MIDSQPSPAQLGRCRRHTATEGSWASAMALMTPPSAARTPPLRGIREGEENEDLHQWRRTGGAQRMLAENGALDVGREHGMGIGGVGVAEQPLHSARRI